MSPWSTSRSVADLGLEILPAATLREAINAALLP
jgi:hypothetical protein